MWHNVVRRSRLRDWFAIGEALTPQETDQILVLGPVLHHHGRFIMMHQVPVSRENPATGALQGGAPFRWD
jgi:hypothetical protein